MKLPDLGEGTVDAEIVSWKVQPGEEIHEDESLVEIMTEKATVEVPAPVTGRLVSASGAPGDRLAVGSELAVFETDAAGAEIAAVVDVATDVGAESREAAAERATGAQSAPSQASSRNARVLTSPAIRRRAREAGIDLTQVPGCGPGGRILLADLEAHVDAVKRETADATEEVRIIGVRRVIAERMSESARTIPHFSYVEEVDVTELERLRVHLNERRAEAAAPLTYLPFLILALVRVLPDHPECNAVHEAARGVVVRHRAVHVGLATQTAEGLKVPVIRDAGRRSLDELAAEIRRLTEAARTGSASRAELTGSTITVTSLGKLGGIASTPIINAPELAIIGVNRAAERPVAIAGAIAIRRMMNLSASFDHRFIDGHDAAAMIQALKERLEHPATIFM
ncbi:MAG: dihydrolipoamide acetyltransferase family protein [Steroidobacteraceae bacterium]